LDQLSISSQRFCSTVGDTFNSAGHYVCYFRTSSSDIPLTGDPDADADIMAFVQARQKLAHRGTPF